MNNNTDVRRWRSRFNDGRMLVLNDLPASSFWLSASSCSSRRRFRRPVPSSPTLACANAPPSTSGAVPSSTLADSTQGPTAQTLTPSCQMAALDSRNKGLERIE